jgi:hypothetical protein
MAQNRRDLKVNASGLLRDLGASASDVAAALVAAGVTGIPGNAEGCAVARYLAVVVGIEPSVCSVVVGTHRVFLHLEGRRRPVGVTMPKPVRELIHAFDGGLHPALIHRPSQSTPASDTVTD